MRRQKIRIRKEDIGDPSNFVHVQHVGFGQKKGMLATQKSLDVGPGQENCASDKTVNNNEEDASVGVAGAANDQEVKVERRSRGSRSSLIPRHHRSTTTCIFPEGNKNSTAQHSNFKKNASTESQGSDSSGATDRAAVSKNGSSLLSRPTFGSLLNLNFLPLGLGKSSSKSSAARKSKGLSLLNLTASHLFAGPKATPEDNKDAIHMTGYTRRRSLSGSEDNSPQPQPPPNDNELPPPPATPKEKETPATVSRPSLAKLGRSKSTMAEFKSGNTEARKRPKLRLKMLPPPPPVPIVPTKKEAEAENVAEEPLPSPPPSPPGSPRTAPVCPENPPQVLRRLAMNTRPRIINLPSSSLLEERCSSAEPLSPLYLTPAGGSSPMPYNESQFPLLSPTIPPACAPFFSNQMAPGTPPVWPLQPAWPTQMKGITIPDIPSPCKEEMEIGDLEEYQPAAAIVESFILNDNKIPENQLTPVFPQDEDFKEGLENEVKEGVQVTPSNIQLVSSVLRNNIQFQDWPRMVTKMFENLPKLDGVDEEDNEESKRERLDKIYDCIVNKTLEVWLEMAGNHATVEGLTKIVEEENLDAAESLRQISLTADTAEESGQ